MRQHRYASYAEYVKAQRKGYEKKKDRVWARSENIAALADMIGPCDTGICHGVRGGQEVEWFRTYTGAQVIGTEIGDSEAMYVIKWDFNKQADNWIGAFDFVYSNAFDHAFAPEDTLAVWWEQVAPGGWLIIETDERNEHTGAISKPVNAVDPTGMTLTELSAMIERVTGDAPQEVPLPVVTFGYRVAVVAKK